MDSISQILGQWHRERPDLDVTPMGLIGRVLRLSRQLTAEMEKTFETFGLTPAGFDVLATLRRSGPPYALSPGALLDSMMVTSGTMTHRVDLLVKAGLVERSPNPDDRRSFIISLTEEGFAVIERAVEAHVATQTRLVALLPAAERRQLDSLLGDFLVRIEGVASEESEQ